MILSLLNCISETSGTNDKLDILRSVDETDLELLKRVFVMALDPNVNFWIKEYNTASSHTSTLTLEQALDSLQLVADREYTGNAAKAVIEELDESLNADDAEVLWRIIQRDLRIGLGAKSINKVFPDLIYVHPYMRCSSFSAKNLANISFPCFSQTKADGMYCDIMVYKDEVVVRSRNGLIIDFVDSNTAIYQELLDLYSGNVIQGELVAIDEYGNDLERSLSNGYVNSDDKDWTKIRLVAWDMIPINHFEQHKCKLPYSTRYNNLVGAISNQQEQFVRLVDTKVCESSEEIIEHFREVRLLGLEGTVIKDFNTTWQFNTSKTQIKVKVVFDCEARVIGYKDGTGRNVGKLGSLICRSEDDQLEFSVGTGFSDVQREQFMNDIDSLIGRVITVKANDVLYSQGKELPSLFLPRFIEFRTDKDEADTLERIEEQVKSFTDALQLIK